MIPIFDWPTWFASGIAIVGLFQIQNAPPERRIYPCIISLGPDEKFTVGAGPQKQHGCLQYINFVFLRKGDWPSKFLTRVIR